MKVANEYKNTCFHGNLLQEPKGFSNEMIVTKEMIIGNKERKLTACKWHQAKAENRSMIAKKRGLVITERSNYT